VRTLPSAAFDFDFKSLGLSRKKDLSSKNNDNGIGQECPPHAKENGRTDLLPSRLNLGLLTYRG